METADPARGLSRLGFPRTRTPRRPPSTMARPAFRRIPESPRFEMGRGKLASSGSLPPSDLQDCPFPNVRAKIGNGRIVGEQTGGRIYLPFIKVKTQQVFSCSPSFSLYIYRVPEIPSKHFCGLGRQLLRHCEPVHYVIKF